MPLEASFTTKILSSSAAIHLERRLHRFVRAEPTISVRPAVDAGADHQMAKKTVAKLLVGLLTDAVVRRLGLPKQCDSLAPQKRSGIQSEVRCE